MSSPASSRFDVVVVGGGASGTLVAAHLLDGEPATRPSVALVEARADVGRGVAYGTRRGEHLLNVRAAGMSAFDDQPGDFVRFLSGLEAWKDMDPAELGMRFVPRVHYAAYLASLHQGPGGASRPEVVRDVAVDVLPAGDGFTVVLASGARLQARAVVLAIGNRAARLPLAGTAGVAVVEAWDDGAVAAIAPDADVCILGAGLSMVDVVLTLGETGHRGRIVSLSRRGLVPLAHAAPAPPATVDLPALLAMDLLARSRAVRRLAAREEAAGRPWQGALDALRPHVQALWTSLDNWQQARFLRHLVRHWDVHRHRIAPEAAARLDAATAAGRLERVAGHVLALEAGERTTVRWRPRGSDRVECFATDVVVNALGMDKRIDGGDDLPGRLCARGLLRPGPHRMGAATIGEGIPLDAAGEPVAGLWTLGTLRIGDLWETIAMPELRGQARRVADAVRAHLGP